jgi:Tfp pilus assembly protein PilX
MVPVWHDVKAGFFLVVVLAMLVFICAIAGLGAMLRPIRWSDRKATR